MCEAVTCAYNREVKYNFHDAEEGLRDAEACGTVTRPLFDTRSGYEVR
jgi:hypothetical protein